MSSEIALFPPGSSAPALQPGAVPYAHLLGTWHVCVSPPRSALTVQSRDDTAAVAGQEERGHLVRGHRWGAGDDI